ncbi:hypothetical protein YC2023_064262 [Brassica napus]
MYLRVQGPVCFVHAEHSIDSPLARVICINTENILLSQPNWREQALSRADTSIRSGALEYKMGDAHMIIQAVCEPSNRHGDSADEESKRNSANDRPAKAKSPRCEK